MVSWFNKLVIIPTFNFLEQYISNYGIIIILLVLFIKILLSPLSYKSYVSMAKMKVINELIKPQLDAFKEKNGKDQQKSPTGTNAALPGTWSRPAGHPERLCTLTAADANSSCHVLFLSKFN